VRITELDREVASLDARREPQQAELSAGVPPRRTPSRPGPTRSPAWRRTTRHIRSPRARSKGLEAEVESCRRDVFGALNQLTALQHAIDNALAARERVQEALSRLDVEASDLRVENEHLSSDRHAA
jgi:predicted  nucleic acid-binding Zn-ribbon protein